MKIFFTIACVFVVGLASAQKFTIKGQLADSIGALPSATILILQQKDSSLVQFGVSDSNGHFEIKNIAPGNYLFKITFTGYQSFVKKISPRPENGFEIDLGKIRLSPQSKQLNEIVVKGEKDPVTVKRDTIEFNAPSFKVKQNGTVEDLLKKIPSIEVDNTGAITAQGEQVQKVMVDGKEFFGQDPTLATRNLPADAIDKVQVYNKKSDQTVFTGIDDGQYTKTINLALKEGKHHAYFGNDMAGGGRDLLPSPAANSGRYQASASLNRFENGNQLSFLGMGNNVNQQGFSFGDYANFSGGGGGGGQNNTGQQSGIVTNMAGGVNLNQAVNNNNTKVNATYFYNRLDQTLSSNTHRINYLDTMTAHGNTYNFDQSSLQRTIVDNHRANINIDQKIDSANSLLFRGSAVYTTNNQNASSVGKTYQVGSTTALQNYNPVNTTSLGKNTTITSSLLLRHRFAKKGRSLAATLSFNYSDNGSHSLMNDTIRTFPNNIRKDSLQNQRTTQSTTSPTYGALISYTEPLGHRMYLEVNYNFSSDVNFVNQNVVNTNTGETIGLLTSNYNSNYLYNKPTLNFRINREKYNLSFGLGLQETNLHSDGTAMTQHVTLNRQFQMVQPALHYNYDFNNFKRFRFDYSTSMSEPSVSQLQLVVNNSNPLNLSTGNPNLKPAYSHQVRSNFTVFNPNNFINLFALINANYTANAITSAQNTDPKTLVRTTIPVNVANSSSISGNFSVGIPVQKIHSRFSLGPNYSLSKNFNALSTGSFNINNLDATLQKMSHSTILQQMAGGTVRYNFTYENILIFDMSANMSYQQTTYSFDGLPSRSTLQNQYYFNKTYTSELNINFLKNYAYNTEMNYFIYNSTTTNFHQVIPLWKMSVSRYLLKNKAGELKLTVNNILNYGVSISQTATSNYLQQVTNNNLGRYFMVSFTYALNKQLNPMNGRDRGRMGGGRGMRMY
ncbi:MAG: outer membrane beta-barrel protein [Bacteroidetes bacterium]|nr:outer membrane beta-barrel protein [Bacteroidota bacterium]MBS1540281.1 outer membrane beta-barrel protein [Bacteroidota bacterium]